MVINLYGREHREQEWLGILNGHMYLWAAHGVIGGQSSYSAVKRAVDEVASKLAEDSHKGINRRCHKSDRRGSVRKLLARWHDEEEMLENPCFRTSVRSQGERSLITRADSRGIVNSRKLQKSSNWAASPACQKVILPSGKFARST